MKSSLFSSSPQPRKKAAWTMLCWLFLLVFCGSWNTVAHAVTVNVTYTDSATTGFNDATLGAARRNAFEATLSYWATHLGPSAVNVNVDAAFTAQGGTASGAVLAYASPSTYRANFASSNPRYKTNTFYPISIANRLSGTDQNGATVEITTRFNSDVDNSTVLGNTDFYYGTDGNNGSDIDFFSVALHEIGHGLGFTGLISSSGAISATYPAIYDTYLTQGSDASRTRLTSMTNAQRATAIKSANLFFDGTRATIANGNLPAKIYAPTTYESGSSTYHLDEATFSLPNINELLTPASSGVAHDAGPVGLGVFYDMGWAVPPQVTSISRADTNPTSSFNTRFNVLFTAPVTGVDASDFTVTTTGSVNGAVTNVSGSGNLYVVTVSNTGGSGTLRLNLVDDDSIVDSDSVALGGPGTTTASGGNGSFATGQAYNLASSGTLTSVLAVNAGSTNIVAIDTSNNTQSLFGSAATNSYGVTRTPDGTVYATNFNGNSITKVSGGTSSVLPVSGTNLLVNPIDIVAGPDGLLYVSNYGGGSTYTIVKVNPSTGVQTLVSSGGSLNLPTGLTFGADGFLYVANANTGVVLKINTVTGAQTTFVATGVGIWGIAFGSDGTLYGTNNTGSAIIKVAPTTLAISTITSAGSLSGPQGIIFGTDGNLYVANNNNSNVVRVTTSGAQTLISSGGSLSNTSDVTTASVALPTLSIADVSQVEGNAGTTSFTFTVSLSGPSNAGVSFDIATANGTGTNPATAPSDYAAKSLTGQTIAAGQSSATFTVLVNGDTTLEENELFTVNVSNVSGASNTSASATGTIQNDDLSNQAPVIASNSGLSVTQNMTKTITAAMLQATDVDGDTPLTYTITMAPTKGTLKLSGTATSTFTQADIAAGKVTYTQDGAFATSDSFGFNVSDGKGGNVAGTFAITITEASSLLVTTTSDAIANDGFTSLREALVLANTQTSSTIRFDSTVFSSQQTITLMAEKALPTITGDVTIQGPFSGVVIVAPVSGSVETVNAGATLSATRLLFFYGGTAIENHGTLSLSQVTLSNTRTGLINSGNATLSGCVLSKNITAIGNTGTLGVQKGNFSSNGTGLSNSGSSAKASVVDSTFSSSNTAISNSASLTLGNSTLSGNETGLINDGSNGSASANVSQSTFAFNGGALLNQGQGTLSVRSCTIAHNYRGISSDGAQPVEVRNTILASNALPLSAPTTPTSGFNLVDIPVAQAGLQNDGRDNPILQDNGGPTPTIALLPGSPAVNAGSTDSPSDQRGVARDARPDMGAFEFNSFVSSLLVTTTSDEDNGTSDARVGTGTSLREAINTANALGGSQTVSFDPSVFSGQQTITLLSGTTLPAPTSNLTINGPSASVIVTAQVGAPVLSIQNGIKVILSRLAFQGGQDAINNAGTLEFANGSLSAGETALVNSGTASLSSSLLQFSSTAIHNSGSLSVSGCTLSRNGTALFNLGGSASVQSSTLANCYTAINNSASLTLGNSTLTGNVQAVLNNGSSAGVTATVSQCTFAFNGGALQNGGKVSMTVRSCTIAHCYQGIETDGVQPVDVNSTLLCSNTLPLGAPLTSTSAYNLFDIPVAQAGLENDGQDNPLLKNNGAPTATIALLPGSIALNKADPALSSSEFDQRGLPRVVGGRADIGAFEFQASAPLRATTPTRKSSAPSS